MYLKLLLLIKILFLGKFKENLMSEKKKKKKVYSGL